MKNLKSILLKLKNKSNIDYEYYHLFNNNKLDLNYNTSNFTINYIIYIINSDFSRFNDSYKWFSDESITDVFFERLKLSLEDKEVFFRLKFKELFWLKLNKVNFDEWDYKLLAWFILNNSLDINRIFLENLNLNSEFFSLFKDFNWFGNLTFINIDNNYCWNEGLNSLIFFLEKNNINLEYLSIINNNISNISLLSKYLNKTDIRILDLSSNDINQNDIISIIENSSELRELYIRNIELDDSIIEKIIYIFKNNKTSIYNLRLSLSFEQIRYVNIFNEISELNNINFDIIKWLDVPKDIYSTIYLKEIDKVKNDIWDISNDYFYCIDSNDLDNDFNKLIKDKDIFLINAINLFLFDFNDYKKIDFLIKKYDFNYIYIENYYITFDDLKFFLESISTQSHKKYKINLISVELDNEQMDYLIDNFPSNIFYIEVNLNKIINDRELYISKMLKNKAFIFENMELYKKIFK